MVNTITSPVGTVTGGYVKIGRLVIVSCKVVLTSDIAKGDKILDGLPTDISSLALPFNIFNTTAYDHGFVQGTGLYTNLAGASGLQLLINGSYISAS